jgi:hypothetical protein
VEILVEAKKGGTSPGESEDLASAPSDATETEAERVVRCANCEATLAREKDAIEVFGAHEHDRMNPGGFLFRIACFARADGAASVGEPSTEFPWFPHHTWTIVVCASCIAHLGWHFRKGPGSPGRQQSQREAANFYGLIVDRISRS